MRYAALAVCFLAATGCDSMNDPADEPPAPGVPISEPLAGDLEVPAPIGCDLTAHERWVYAWDDAGKPLSVEGFGFDETLGQGHAFVWDDAGRLMEWTRNEDDVLTIERDEAGVITSWTRQVGAEVLLATVTREADAVTVTTEGPHHLELDNGLPPALDLDALAPDLIAVTPRMDLLLWAFIARVNDEEDGTRFVGVGLRQVRTLDAEGRPVRVAIDIDADGTDDVVERLSYDGDQTVIELDAAMDGEFEIQTIETRRDGLLVETIYDDIRDNDAPKRMVHTRLADRLLTDTYAGEELIQRTAIFYNAAGDRVLKYEDEEADGRPDWRKRYVYDDATGLRLYEERDGNADGSIDERWDYAYDATGRLIEEVRTDPRSDACDRRW